MTIIYMQSPLFPGNLLRLQSQNFQVLYMNLICQTLSVLRGDPTVLEQLKFKCSPPKRKEDSYCWEGGAMQLPSLQEILEDLTRYGFYRVTPKPDNRFFQFQYNETPETYCFVHQKENLENKTFHLSISSHDDTFTPTLSKLLSRFGLEEKDGIWIGQNLEDPSLILEFLKQANFTLLFEDEIAPE